MNDWEEILKSANPMDRVLLSHSWAKYYEDFEDNTGKYEKVFQTIEEKIQVKFNIYHHTYVQKVAVFSKNRFYFVISKIRESFLEENERDMFPPEINILRFTLMYASCLRKTYEQEELMHYPIYVFEKVAEAIVDVLPGFFEGLNVNIIEKTW